MSGPKSGSWCLVPAGSGGGTYSFADMQQILRRHLAKIDALERRLAELQKASPSIVLNRSLDRTTLLDITWAESAVEELNHRHGIYVALRDAVEWAEAEAAEVKAQEEARRRLEAEKARIAAEEVRLAAERAARVQSTNALAANLASQRAERIAAEASAEADARAAIGRRAISNAASLLPGVADQVRAQIEALAVACLAEASSEHSLLLANDLKVRVDRANSALKAEQKRLADQRKIDAERAQAVHARLSELGSPARGELNDRLYEVIDGERALDAGLQAKVASAVRAAEQARATEILKEALSDLGYVVGEDFETAFVDGGGFFQKPEWGDYHCRLTMDADRARVSVFMVRAVGETATSIDRTNERDREMEVAWCAELPALLGRLREKNLVMDLHRRMEPGTVPVPIVKRGPTARKRRLGSSAEVNGRMERQTDKT